MPAIFLDFDGVLIHGWGTEPPVRRTSLEQALRDRLDPEAIGRLNLITDATGANIVLSTSWRHKPWAQVAAILGRCGVTGRVVGRTPIRGEHDPSVFERYRGRAPAYGEPIPRGFEIQQWVEANPSVCDRIVILDDEDDMEHLRPFLVLTSWDSGGLRLAHATRAIAILDHRSPAQLR